MSQNRENSYIAFISYRHKELDKKAAELIQKKIENYVIPKEFRESPEQKRFGHCFRDEDELPASSSLSASIYEALDASKYLIVICTPDLPESSWCQQEIEYFLKTHDRDHVIAVLANGTPAESFPEQLLHVFDEEGVVVSDCEPLAANIAGPDHTIDKKSLKKESVRIFAALLGCPFDALWQREKRARIIRLAAASAAALVIALAFVGILLERNARINEQNKELNRQLSTVYTDSGFSKLEGLQIKEALKDGLSALESGDPEIYDHRAIKLLGDGLGAYQTDQLSSHVVYEQQTAIKDLWVTADEKHVILLENTGTIRCLSMDGFTEEWSVRNDDPKAKIYADFPDHILCKNRYGLYALSLESGSRLWYFEHLDSHCENYFQALSPDHSLFAVLDKATEEEAGGQELTCVRFLDTADGHQTGLTVLRLEEEYTPYFNTYSPQDEAEYTPTFSEDGELLLFALPVRWQKDDGSVESMALIQKIDLATFEHERVVRFTDQHIFEGFYVTPDHGRMLMSSLDYTGMIWMFSGNIPVTSSEDWAYTTIGHNFQTPGGIEQEYKDLSPINRCRMLVYRNYFVVFSDNTMFLFDMETTKASKVYPMSGQIVNASWLDQQNGLFEVICSDGYVIDYKFYQEEEKHLFERIEGKPLGHALIRGVPVGGSLIRQDEGSSVLSISQDNPKQLVQTAYFSDPNETCLQFPDWNSSETGFKAIYPVPNTDLALGFLQRKIEDQYKTQLVVFDRVSGEEVSSGIFEDISYYSLLVPVDAEHFLEGEWLYSIDGEKEQYGEPYLGSRYPDEHVILSDGSVLSLTNDDSVSSYIQPLWLSGTLIEASTDRSTAMIIPEDGAKRRYTLGANGFAVRYGRDISLQSDNITVQAETPRFSAFDVQTECFYRIEDPYPEGGFRTIVLGNQKPLMAVHYDEGRLCLFDIKNGSCTELGAYSKDEVVAAGFLDDDSLLVVLRLNGTMDFYDTVSGTLSFQAESAMLQEFILNDLGSKGGFTELAALSFEDGLVCISVGTKTSGSRQHCVLADADAKIIIKEIKDIYMIDPDNAAVYLDRYKAEGSRITERLLIRFPIYNNKELIAWAKEEIGE